MKNFPFILNTAMVGIVVAVPMGCGKSKVTEKLLESDRSTESEASSPKDSTVDHEGNLPSPRDIGGRPGGAKFIPNSNGIRPDDLKDNLNLDGIKGFALIKESSGLRLSELNGESADSAAEVESASNVASYDQNGDVQNVTFANGQFSLRFSEIYATPKAFIFNLGHFGPGYCTALLVRKDNGKIFCISSFVIRTGARDETKKMIQPSQSGDTVVVEGLDNSRQIAGPTFLFRLRLEDPNMLRIETIYDKDGFPEQWGPPGDLLRHCLQ